MKAVALLLLTALLPFGLAAQNHYKVYSTAKHKLVTLDDVIARMANADILFFGEEHNDTVQHSVELLLLQKLNARYPDISALSLEMFETDTQPILDEYLSGLVTEKFLVSDARAWPNYKTDYRPLIERAKAYHRPVIAANAPGRYVNLTNRESLAGLQKISAQAKAYLPPLPIDTATGAYYEKFSQLMGGHGSMGGMQLYQAQNLWDATMGWSIARFYKAHNGFKVLQINGGFHSEDKLGAAAQVSHYAPGIRIMNIAAYADEKFANPDWAQYTSKGDYIILTDFKADNQ